MLQYLTVISAVYSARAVCGAEYTDSHNLDDRKPNWDLLKKKVKEPVIKEAMELLQKHFRKE